MVGRERESIVESNKNKLSIKYYYTDMNAYRYFLLCLVGLSQQLQMDQQKCCSLKLAPEKGAAKLRACFSV